jgi:transcriptional regulator with XRE-family HTH domain
VRGGEVLQRARRRAGLSVSELADRLGVNAAEVASWEGGDPPFSIIQGGVEACQISLCSVLTVSDPDPHDLSLLDANLLLTPEERLRRMVSYVRFIEAGRAAVKARR